jgi:hypothetical protein
MSVDSPVVLFRDPRGSFILRLKGAYTIFDVERVLRAERIEGGPLVVDFSQAEVDHSAFELERMAALLAAASTDLTLRTRDVLRFGFARTIMGYCSSKGVTVRIDHSGH